MTIDWKSQAIEQLSMHWEGQLRPRLDGLTDDEYFWEPVKGCWTIHHRDEKRTAMQAGQGEMVYDFEFPEPDPPPITTIAWRLGHIGSSIFLVRAENHFGNGLPEPWWDHIEWPATAKDALDFVDDGYARWMKGLATLDDDALARPVGQAEGPYAEKPMAALILHISREVIHHGAEVALLRDLYRARA
jgi:hypothetical protein